ncbi:cell wall function protein [Kocuria polaris]|nr:cell wall function protein [Kocuria polaris]
MKNAFRNRWVKVAAQAVVLAALIVGVVSYVGASKTLAVTVDGETQSVTTFGSTVSDALAASDIEVADRDEVTPALDAAIEDGTEISVNRHKSIELVVDGEQRTVGTTGVTVADVLAQLGLEKDADVSAGIDMELASLSSAIEIQTPKNITFVVGGEDEKFTTTATTVEDALAEADVQIGDDDIVGPKDLSTEVRDGMKIRVIRVSTETRSETKAIAHEVKKVNDSSIDKGETKVETKGKNGERELTHEVVLHNGEVESSKLVADEVVTEPVTEVVKVGTRVEKKAATSSSSSSSPSSSSAGTTASGPNSGTWAALAKCESGGNWSINTGNGYYGGLQFSASSWAGAGGTRYAPLPHQATPAEQIATAEVLRSNGGWGHWPSCSSKLGLR